MREANTARKTAETEITARIDLDGTGVSRINTGVGFLDHMLTLLSKYSKIDMEILAKGDLQVDFHHTVEDTGIVLGGLILKALSDMRGITRYGSAVIPMDEALVLCALDISGRAHLSYTADIPALKVGDFDTELAEEFFAAFARAGAMTLHIKQLDGRNSHHIIEAMFKGLGMALRAAVAIDGRAKDEIPSTKGVIL
jgi:imidazoleglycerol-phosphate dehydratase